MKARNWSSLIINLALLTILGFGAYLRVAGLYWGEYTYMHPDERFLVWVGTDISPVENLSEYWDTARSSLNPHNRGHGFYVYGTLPMFLARYVTEWLYGRSGFNEMTNVGRALSALADLGTVLLVFLVASRVFDKRVGLLAAAFSAFAVLQIQHAHFFTMDSFTTFFTLLGVYFVVKVMLLREAMTIPVENYARAYQQVRVENVAPGASVSSSQSLFPSVWRDQAASFVAHPLFFLSIGFGIALGMAVASKVSAGLVAFLLPIAIFMWWDRTSTSKRAETAFAALGYLALAALVSLLVFRIFQPYAFSGPGFFGLKPNPAWIANLRELSNQSKGDVDFPPALQWARRPIWFALQNMVLWGMGLPLGILAWVGFLWAGWRIYKGSWRQHLLLWVWTAVYFTWQSVVFNPSMRYQLLIYPTLAIFAAWAVVALYDLGKNKKLPAETQFKSASIQRLPIIQLVAFIIGAIVLVATAAYAFAFTNIYLRPFTRVAASRWIYQNVPGPINLNIQIEEHFNNQTIPFPYEYLITPEKPFTTSFSPQASGALSGIKFGEIIDPSVNTGDFQYSLIVSEFPGGGGLSSIGTAKGNLSPVNQTSQDGLTFLLNQPFFINQGQEYHLQFKGSPGQRPEWVSGEFQFKFQVGADLSQALQSGEIYYQHVPVPVTLLGSVTSYSAGFVGETTGVLMEASFHPQETGGQITGEKTLTVTISAQPDGIQPLASARITDRFETGNSLFDAGFNLSFDSPIDVVEGQTYYLTISLDEGAGVTLKGADIANEGAWDDGLPLRIDGYDGFGGIYTPGLNFDMYEDDNPNKLERFLQILDQAEYIVITSSRQWGTLPRIPERFPMTSVYYRSLVGCPSEWDIERCYNHVQPGKFRGELGFDLVQVFQSNPSLGLISLNDQSAEEAFTVYDHPKVFIFQKREDYDPNQVRTVLSSVNLAQVIHLTPKGADRQDRKQFLESLLQPINTLFGFGASPTLREMMLPADRLASQFSGGTWSDLFNTLSPINRWPILGAAVWYLVITFLGLISYPLVRLALPGLPDRGYPLARVTGLLLTSFLVWFASSFQIPFSRLTISIVLLLVTTVGLILAFAQWESLRQEWRSRRRYFLLVESLFLAFFVLDVLIRLGNPDLWHPWKGGERPMDFSYLNAILKSSTFPPYDPWFAGGYINYYYYGFVLVGVWIKWLGLVPAIAYNLILPTIFTLIAMGAFSIGWNLFSKNGESWVQTKGSNRLLPAAFIPAIASSLGMAFFGNLATLRMIFHGYQRLATPDGIIEGANYLVRWFWAAKGAMIALLGEPLPYALADWYWNPSRAIPSPNDVEPITEFPFFSILYGDPHAHLFALPLSLLALSWALSMIFGHAWSRSGPRRRSSFQIIASLFLGSLAIGALYPTNTWDFPTYLMIGIVASGYALWQYACPESGILARIKSISPASRRLLIVFAGTAVTIVLALLLFQPYLAWNVTGYTAVELWTGNRTPFWSYLTHWGLFLFVIVSWMFWETYEWMAATPLSSVRKLSPHRPLIFVGIAVLFLWVLMLTFSMKISIAWLVMSLAVWAAVLILRPALPDAKRFVLFLVGIGLLLTLMVEIIRLVGDIGRMNTVFKFYLQVWTLFAISSAAALGWLLKALPKWTPTWRSLWQSVLVGLVAAAALYPLLGTVAKIKDRMVTEAPHTLDGMAFMRYAFYNDLNTSLDLSKDYRAIRWMQENVIGSPVIVEANMVEYHWGTRYTVYTGLPNVVGWNWHQRQQRIKSGETLVQDRVIAVGDFYLTEDMEAARNFLQRFGVRYIIVGQLERALYPGPGLTKFDELAGSLWQEVYREGETVIYEVIGMQ